MSSTIVGPPNCSGCGQVAWTDDGIPGKCPGISSATEQEPPGRHHHQLLRPPKVSLRCSDDAPSADAVAPPFWQAFGDGLAGRPTAPRFLWDFVAPLGKGPAIEEIKINICFPLVSLLSILFASLIGLTLIRLLGCLRLPFVDFVRLSVHSMASTTMAIGVWQIATLSANWQ